MKRRLQQSRGGVLLVALLLVLVFFGVLAGMQTLVVVQASLVTRSLAFEHLRAEYRHRVSLALQEAAQSSLDDRTPALFAERADRLLQGLGCQAGAVSVETTGVLETGRSWLPMMEAKAGALSEAGGSLVLDYPALRLAATDPVELAVAKECRVHLTGLVGKDSSELLRFELRSVGVPLCSRSTCLYEMPSEIGQVAEAGPVLSEGLGFRLRGGDSDGGELRVPQALPYFFRQRASLAQSYASLFSNAAVGRLVAAAGPEGFGLLRQGQVLGGARFVSQQKGFAALDLSEPGLPLVQVVSAQDAGQVLQVEERVVGAVRTPMVLLLVGQCAAPLQVQLGSCERPVLLVGINVVLAAAAGTRWKGGVLLAPGSRVAAGTTGLRLSHFSCHLASAPAPGAVVADLPADRDLIQLYPRTYYAGVRGLWQ